MSHHVGSALILPWLQQFAYEDFMAPTRSKDAFTWVAVKELKLSYYILPPIMENQMEKKMENEMEAGKI